MTQQERHWGSAPSAADTERNISVREAAGRDFSEARILVDRIYREYRESGGRTELDRLLASRRDLPWYLRKEEAPR